MNTAFNKTVIEQRIIVARILLEALTDIMSLLDVRITTNVRIPEKFNLFTKI